MDIVSKSEKDFMRLLPVAAPMLLVFILIISFTSWYTSKSAISPFKYILINQNAIITLCDKVILKSELIHQAFEGFRHTKVSGSSPVNFYSLNGKSGKSGNNISELSIGQDSKNHNLFWLYPKQTSTYYRGADIGFIESEYIKTNTEKCE